MAWFDFVLQLNIAARCAFVSSAWQKVNEETHTSCFWAGYNAYITAVIQPCILRAKHDESSVAQALDKVASHVASI